VSFIKQEGAAGIGVYAKRFTAGFATVGAAARVAQSTTASTSSVSDPGHGRRRAGQRVARVDVVDREDRGRPL
jgi:hypothetical protein